MSKPKRMTFTVPDEIAHEIRATAKALGMQQKILKEWVALEAFQAIEQRGINEIVRDQIAEQLDLRLE